MSEEAQNMLRQSDDETNESTSDDLETCPSNLRCSVGFANPTRIIRALESGGSLGDGKLLGEYDFDDIHPETLKLHFDSCISARFKFTEIDDLLVTFDYRTLLPTAEESSETAALKRMSEIPELHHLFVHPLISSYIYLKWCTMRIFCCINLSLVSLFCLSLAAYVYISNTGVWYECLVKAVLILLYLILIARECLEVYVLKLRYLREPTNWIGLKMLSICFGVIFVPPGESFKQLCAFSILMSVLHLGMLAIRNPRLSTPIIMLRKVTETFFYFLSWYSILFFGFVLSFYELSRIQIEDKFNSTTLESNNTINDTTADNNNIAEIKTTPHSFFPGVFVTFFDSVIMLTGELNASPDKIPTWAHKLVLIFFIFMITIVLVNLLCGLAVCDAEFIRKQSEESRYIETARYIANTEEFIIGLSNFLSNVKRLEKLYNFFQNRFYEKVFLYPYFTERRKFENISVYQPNKNLYIEDKTLQKVKYFLLQNQNAEIINELREISKNRKEIRNLSQYINRNSS